MLKLRFDRYISLCIIATMIAGRTQTDVQTLMEEDWLCLDHMTGE